MHGALGVGVSLVLDLAHGVGLFLLEPLHEILLQLLLLGLQARAVIGVDLLVLGYLLLELGELGLQGRFLENLGLLVVVEDARGDELVEGLSGMLLEEGIRLGSVDLGANVSSMTTDELQGSRAGTDGGFVCEREGVLWRGTHDLLVHVANVPRQSNVSPSQLRTGDWPPLLLKLADVGTFLVLILLALNDLLLWGRRRGGSWRSGAANDLGGGLLLGGLGIRAGGLSAGSCHVAGVRERGSDGLERGEACVVMRSTRSWLGAVCGELVCLFEQTALGRVRIRKLRA